MLNVVNVHCAVLNIHNVANAVFVIVFSVLGAIPAAGLTEAEAGKGARDCERAIGLSAAPLLLSIGRTRYRPRILPEGQLVMSA